MPRPALAPPPRRPRTGLSAHGVAGHLIPQPEGGILLQAGHQGVVQLVSHGQGQKAQAALRGCRVRLGPDEGQRNLGPGMMSGAGGGGGEALA